MLTRPFGTLSSGETVLAYILRGAGGLEFECIPYGGIVTRLLVPDRTGRLADVVLGFSRLEDYVAPHPFFGAIAGRVAGRLTRGRFTLDGRTYALAVNNGPNHLHGGLRGFDKYLWTATPVARPDGAPSLRLSRLSPDGEEGYPGNVTVEITYTVTADNTFLIETEAKTDRATPFSLTQHSYFNLAGEGSGPITDHTLQVFADSTAAADDAMTLLGRREPVAGANDFRSPRRLGDAIPGLHLHHGDLYFLPDSGAALREAARLHDPQSGRTLTVRTTEPCLQVYTGVALDGTLTGKSGQPYNPYAGLCLECEGYPDGPNTPEFGDIILPPDRPHRSITAYSFSNHV